MQLFIQHHQDKVICFIIASGWGPTSTLHSFGQKKKKDILLPSTVPQLLLVNRSAVSFLEDDLPANLGGGASEQGGGCCCKHNAWSSTESWLSQQVKIGTNKGERQGNVTDLIAQVTTDSQTGKPSLYLLYACLYFCCLCFHSLPQGRKRKSDDFFLDPSQVGNTSFFPHVLESVVFHSLISPRSVLSPQVIHGENAAAIQILCTVLSLIQLILAQNTGLKMMNNFLFFYFFKEENNNNK